MTKDQHQAEAHLEQVKKLDKTLGTNRGIETMFRSAYRVQMDLTGLADNKANMMISINGIIISIIIAAVAPKLDANPWLTRPTRTRMPGKPCWPDNSVSCWMSSMLPVHR